MHNIDWPTAMVVLVYGAVCWMGGWHASLKSSGKMYDEGYRAGHADGRANSRQATLPPNDAP